MRAESKQRCNVTHYFWKNKIIEKKIGRFYKFINISGNHIYEKTV